MRESREREGRMGNTQPASRLRQVRAVRLFLRRAVREWARSALCPESVTLPQAGILDLDQEQPLVSPQFIHL